jgi:hypothetical protein
MPQHSIVELGIPHVQVLLLRTLAGTTPTVADWVADNTLLSGLGLGIQETLLYLNSERPALEQFEQWILEKNGGFVPPALVARINAAIAGELGDHDASSVEPALTLEDLAFWDANGYVIVHDAILENSRRAAELAIYEFLKVNPDDPETWYRKDPAGATIWVPFLHHPALIANRHSPRIYNAFAQLWGRRDLWVNTDQCGFNPPERDGWRFPGPYLHWDTSLYLPMPFGTQGILYLTDTAADQGAFQCVPGFHRKIEEWLRTLPPDVDPRKVDLSVDAVRIAGRAGDLVIWHQSLPHGASPNRSERPRVVQYLNMRPSEWEYSEVWK